MCLWWGGLVGAYLLWRWKLLRDIQWTLKFIWCRCRWVLHNLPVVSCTLIYSFWRSDIMKFKILLVMERWLLTLHIWCWKVLNIDFCFIADHYWCRLLYATILYSWLISRYITMQITLQLLYTTINNHLWFFYLQFLKSALLKCTMNLLWCYLVRIALSFRPKNIALLLFWQNRCRQLWIKWCWLNRFQWI